LYWVLALAATVHAEEITLQQALSAVQGLSPEELEVKIAASRVRVLESMSKRNFELRPQLGILTLTNPVVLAASLGSNFLVNRNSAPSRFALLGARTDLLATELLYSQSSFNKKMQTSRAFFDLVAAQRYTKQACDERTAHERARSTVERLVARGRLTMVDQLRYEQEAVQIISECLDSEIRRKLASAALGTAIGVRQADLTAVLPEPTTGLFKKVSINPEADSSAFSASVPENLRLKAAEIRRVAAGGSRVKMPDVSFFQSNLKEAGNTGSISPDYLAGGNFLYPTISWRIPLRDTGQNKAEAELLKAKLEKLEAGIEAYEHVVADEVETLEAMNSAAPQRIELEEQKLDIATRSREMITLRYQKGLALLTDVFAAEQQERRLRASVVRMRSEAAGRKLMASVLFGSSPTPGDFAGLKPQPASTLQAVAVKPTDEDERMLAARSTQDAPHVRAERPVAIQSNVPKESTPMQAHRSRRSQGRTTSDHAGPRVLICGVVNGRVGNCVPSPRKADGGDR
jgi:outer membrane protein TolC